MRDGTILRADLWTPSGQTRCPVVLMRFPYGRTGAQDWTDAHPWWWARRGDSVVVQDTRGRYSSDGEFTRFSHEGDDTIEWVSNLAICSGRVGMYGFSYAGATQLMGAVRRPPALAAIVPAMTQADFYQGSAYLNGAFSLAFNTSWATFLAQDVARRQRDPALEAALMAQFVNAPQVYGTLPFSEMPYLTTSGPGGFYQDWIEHEGPDAYWSKLDSTSRLHQISASVLTIAGLWDIFLDGSTDIYNRVKGGGGGKHRLIIGPWFHVPWIQSFGELDFGPEATNNVSEVQLQFFDQWLRDSSPADGPLVEAFISGANRWQGFEEWHPATTELEFHLHGDGRANSLSGRGFLTEESPGREDPDFFSYDPSSPVPSLGGRSCCVSEIAPIGPADQRPVEMMNQVLVYTSRVFEDGLFLAGTIRVHLFAATSARDTDWTVKICDIPPDGRSINIQESIQRARWASKKGSAQLVPANEVTEFVFDVGSCCHLIEAGHAIRVEISSSDFPQWDRNLNTGNPLGVDAISDRVVVVQNVFHDVERPSRVVLPVVTE